jgi:glycosyltransferase involved in cell wall biosynthesis
MACLRVFLLTYRRPHLLRRALGSLLRQTMTDWVCELHNDAPDDDSPRAVLGELAPRDPRIAYHRHDHNWGAVASFNHAFAGGPEPYASILEDDNWWEADFLIRTLDALERHPAAALAWTNLRLWREETDGSWTDTGRHVWRAAPGAAPRYFERPVALQAVNALHSNGAMVYRVALSTRALVPPQTPFDIIEPVRERLLSGGLVLVPDALANFALARSSARSADPGRWLQSQLLVIASFSLRARLNSAAAAALWRAQRGLRPRSTDGLLLAGLCGAAPRSLLRHSRLGDWLHFLPRALRHPGALCLGLRFRRDHAELWQVLRAAAGPVVDAEPLVVKELATSAP